MVKAREILLITLLVVVGFVMSDVIAQRLALYSSLQRFGMRLGFMLLFMAVIYLFFDSRDTSRRLRRLERIMLLGRKGHDEQPDANTEKEEGRNE